MDNVDIVLRGQSAYGAYLAGYIGSFIETEARMVAEFPNYKTETARLVSAWTEGQKAAAEYREEFEARLRKGVNTNG